MEVLKRCVVVDPGFPPRLIVDLPESFLLNQRVIMMRPIRRNIYVGPGVDRGVLAFDVRVLRRPEKSGEFVVLVAQGEAEDDELRVMFRRWLP